MNQIRLLIISLLLSTLAAAQDTLPRFSVTNAGKNRFIVGWVNNYPVVKQIGIQRSHDSLKNFKTILTVADPNAKQNGFADTRAPNDHMFYRLFVVLDKGQFFFTEAKKPMIDTSTTSNIELTRNPVIDKAKDSIAAIIKPIVPKKPEFVPSFYVYTNKDGYVYINLPDADRKKYHIKFYEDNDAFLFEIKNISETGLTLDKTNFMRAGWYKFELYHEEKLVEKNKFYLAKEF
jgi:hypothetical protein